MNLNNSNILQHIHHYTYLKEDLLGKGATGTVYQGIHFIIYRCSSAYPLESGHQGHRNENYQ